MRLTLLAVGRLKDGAERELVDRYATRATALARSLGFSAFEAREVQEGRAARVEQRRAEEARSLRAALPAGARLALCDERGAALTSAAFAADIGRARDTGLPAYALALGGPDGFDPALRGEASLVVAFGAMTWPHQLARVMAAEQLYRALTILGRHPYHRG